MTTEENIIKDFRKEFGYLDKAYRFYAERIMGVESKTIPTEDLEQFLLSAIKKSREEIEKTIKVNMFKRIDDSTNKFITEERINKIFQSLK